MQNLIRSFTLILSLNFASKAHASSEVPSVETPMGISQLLGETISKLPSVRRNLLFLASSTVCASPLMCFIGMNFLYVIEVDVLDGLLDAWCILNKELR